MQMTSPNFTSCEAKNLALIEAKFGAVAVLTYEQTSQLIGTTANNIAQLVRRGHVPFNLVSMGKRVFFPVWDVAGWLCGTANNPNPVAVQLPKKTPLRVRSSADLRARLCALRLKIEQRAKKLKESDDPTGLKEARVVHAEASRELFALFEREELIKNYVTPLHN